MVRRVHYDPDADILYIVVKEGPVEDTVEAGEDVFIELGEGGEVIGVEIWRASKNVIRPITQVLAEEIKQQLASQA